MEFKLPTWEASKEIADQLPGEKGDPKQCPECGAELDKDPQNQKDKKAF